MLKTKVSKSIMIISLLLTPLLVNAMEATNTKESQIQFIGKAYDMNTNKFLYTEHHNYTSEKNHIVNYKEINGDLFATKKIDYKNSYFSPNITQLNNRNGEEITTLKSNGKMKITYQESKEHEKLEAAIDYTPRLIIDAGFDNFITHNWSDLINGKELSIDYLIPSRLDHYELSIKKVPCKTNNLYCFNISASSFFIRIFSNDLKLAYEVFEKRPRLKSFQGRSNICDKKGNYQDVVINYQYESSSDILNNYL